MISRDMSGKIFIAACIMVFAFTFMPYIIHAQNEFSNATIGVGVVVKNLERSLDFYTKIIGMKRTGTIPLDADFAKRSGLSNGIPFEIAVLKLIDTPEATQWKLMSFNSKTIKQKAKHIQDNIGVQYITIDVTDLGPVVARIKANNIKLLGETPTSLGDGKRFFVLIQDPDGTFIELIGPMQ